MKLKAEADGRMFPISDDSADIADCLLNEARRQGIAIRTRANVTTASRTDTGCQLTLADGTRVIC